ncbi:MAG TPA: Na+/H+ antiporter subunit E [Sulfurovum sp. UBA12169]|nr:MAG TPA: Na+/H+ antiporter subunit E [Sulfurovum sp. UBA12169]
MKKIKTFLPHPILSIALVFMWLLLNNTLSAGHVMLGTILAVLIPWFTSDFWPEQICVKHPLTFLKFTGIVAYDILVANIAVSRLILGPNKNLKPTFFNLPLDIKHPLGISLLASTISLTPGTVSCDLSEDKTYLIIHGLSINNIDQAIDEIKTRYEKPLMEVFKLC